MLTTRTIPDLWPGNPSSAHTHISSQLSASVTCCITARMNTYFKVSIPSGTHVLWKQNHRSHIRDPQPLRTDRSRDGKTGRRQRNGHKRARTNRRRIRVTNSNFVCLKLWNFELLKRWKFKTLKVWNLERCKRINCLQCFKPGHVQTFKKSAFQSFNISKFQSFKKS